MRRILLVDTDGALCAPLAVALVRHEVTVRDVAADLEVARAGTGQSGGTIDPRVLRELDRRRVSRADLGDLRCGPLRPDDIIGADLVLTMTRSLRAHVVELEPEAVRRVFCLREFGALVAQAAPRRNGSGGGLRNLVDRVADSRGTVPPPRGAEQDDVSVGTFWGLLAAYRFARVVHPVAQQIAAALTSEFREEVGSAAGTA